MAIAPAAAATARAIKVTGGQISTSACKALAASAVRTASISVKDDPSPCIFQLPAINWRMLVSVSERPLKVAGSTWQRFPAPRQPGERENIRPYAIDLPLKPPLPI